MENNNENHGLDNSRAWLTTICDLVQKLHDPDEAVNEEARQSIYEAPLSIECRTAWCSINDRNRLKNSEFRILLTCGGPSCEIVGELDQYEEPTSATLIYNNWGSDAKTLEVSDLEKECLLEFAQQFIYSIES